MSESPEKIKQRLNQSRVSWEKYHIETQEQNAGERPYPFSEFSIHPPIFATKSFVYPSMNALFQNKYHYARNQNPTTEALEQKLATLYKADTAITVASGMAALYLVGMRVFFQRVDRISSGKLKELYPQAHPEIISNLVVHLNQYSGTYRLLQNVFPQLGIEIRRVDMTNLTAVKNAIDQQTKMVFLETPANPKLDILDIQSIAAIMKKGSKQAKLVVDNTFASPVLQQPLHLGADIVIESMTKYLNGHGDCLGGVIIGSEDILRDIHFFWLELLGPTLSPFSAWLILRGIRTLTARMKMHCDNGLIVAKFLQEHPKVSRVIYPGLPSHPGHDLAQRQMSGFGGMLGFELKSDQACLEFMERLQLVKVGVSLGDTCSIIEYTPYMTGLELSPKERKVMGVSTRYLRLSVGLENPEDLVTDLQQALEVLPD